jgi:hypothetical protein
MMADRRFTIQAEPRGVNTIKTIPAVAASKDDIQTAHTNPSPTSPVGGRASPEHRLSQVFLRRISLPMNNRKSSMFFPSNFPRANTYRMEPENEYRFRPYKLQDKILEILIEQMKGQTYNPATVNDLVKDISRTVHQLMKTVELPRYKIITQTTIGQKLDQILSVASRCLWDPKTDNMISVNYECRDMFGIVNVYAVYLD